MALDVHAVVPNIDDATFQKIAAATKEGCPVSKALSGNVAITLNAVLAS
jgi:osmotically inducible protein OsmC